MRCEPSTDYVIPSDWGGEDERLRLLGEWRDPITLARMERLGLGPGWRCLEVGVGSGLTARAMAARVGGGGGGRVTAADINAAFVARLEGAPDIDAVQCDIRIDDFPAGSFDLIHTRLVLEHLPDPAAVMRRMVEWLAPGGWLLFEEPDTAQGAVSPDDLWARHMQAYAADPGYDCNYGRRLPADVARLGVVAVDAEMDTAMVRGGTDLARWYAMTIEAVRPGLVSTGRITAAELDELAARLGRPGLLEPGMTFVAVWGRQPTG